MRKLLSILLLLLSLSVWADNAVSYYGLAVGLGHEQPWTEVPTVNMSTQDYNNQLSPLLLASDGRYCWQGEWSQAGTTLRDAYMAAMQAHFPFSGLLPDTLFFARPQYNTWIELMYDQNQTDILQYAHAIVDNGFAPGVLMIDDNWQRYYGNFDFKSERFPDPRAMMDELHALGFKVMVWVCPFVSPDSPEARELDSKGYLLRSPNGEMAVLRWWNGASACYDLTNPAAADAFVQTLREAQTKYGIDGFKFDAGDNCCYASTPLAAYDKNASFVDHTESWARIGLHFPVNEFRACWKMGGQPLVQRLGDKDYSWDAVQQLIPQMLTAGLLGYAYACPDMIGGGQWTGFLNIASDSFDQELIVRSAQVHALMPMMQFSVAPWRVLNQANLAVVREAADLHVQFAPYIMRLAHEATQTGEPIVRSMEYQFPHQGLAACRDQFMLGDRYLVAPMVQPGTSRTVQLPRGTWRDEQGKTYRGGKTYTISVPLSRLPYFEKIK